MSRRKRIKSPIGRLIFISCVCLGVFIYGVVMLDIHAKFYVQSVSVKVEVTDQFKNRRGTGRHGRTYRSQKYKVTEGPYAGAEYIHRVYLLSDDIGDRLDARYSTSSGKINTTSNTFVNAVFGLIMFLVGGYGLQYCVRNPRVVMKWGDEE